MNKAFRKLAAVAAGCVLIVGLGAGSASAFPVDLGFFFLPGGSSGGNPVTAPSGTTNYQLWVNNTNAVTDGTTGPGSVGANDIKIISSGSLSMNTFVANAGNNVGTTSLIGNTLTIATSLPITISSGVFELGTINVVNAGGNGDVTLFSADYLDNSSNGHTVNPLPQVLAISTAAIPEPGTLVLVGAGMAGLGLLIRRARS